MVPVDSVGVSRAPTYSGTSCKRRRFNCRVRGCHPLWLTFPDHSASRPLCNSYKRPYNPAGKIPTVWAVPLSLAATDGIDFSFSSTGYLDVSVHRVSDPYLWIQYGTVRESWDHHSFVNSPRLFADFHALQSLLTPRHPPCALNSLTTYIQRSMSCKCMNTSQHHCAIQVGPLPALPSHRSDRRTLQRFSSNENICTQSVSTCVATESAQALVDGFDSPPRHQTMLNEKHRTSPNTRATTQHLKSDANYHNQIVKDQHRILRPAFRLSPSELFAQPEVPNLIDSRNSRQHPLATFFQTSKFA